MDTLKYMIIIKDEIATSKIQSCKFNDETKKYDITFENEKIYHYSSENIIIMDKPILLKPQNYIIKTPKGKELFNIKYIYQFENNNIKYWHIIFDNNGKEYASDYKKDDLIVEENCLQDKKSLNVLEYLKKFQILVI